MSKVLLSTRIYPMQPGYYKLYGERRVLYTLQKTRKRHETRQLQKELACVLRHSFALFAFPSIYTTKLHDKTWCGVVTK